MARTPKQVVFVRAINVLSIKVRMSRTILNVRYVNAPRVVVAMLGARMHYAVPRLLERAGMLAAFFTDNYLGNKLWLRAILLKLAAIYKAPVLARWLGRLTDEIPPAKVTSFERLGIRCWLQRKRAKTDEEFKRLFADNNRRFNEQIVKHGIGDANIVWGFNGASLELFFATQ